MDNDKIKEMALDVIGEVFGTIAYGIVPSDDSSDEDRQWTVYSMCGEVLANRYVESAGSIYAMSVDDAIKVSRAIGELLSHKSKKVEG